MNLGKRIDKRLNDLKWERKKLFDALPDLSPQALSNLIVRDSKRSEWDVQIADVLGVSVMWLVYGDAPYSDEHTATEAQAESPAADVYKFESAATRSVAEIMATLDDNGQAEVLRFAKFLADKPQDDQNSNQRAG